MVKFLLFCLLLGWVASSVWRWLSGARTRMPPAADGSGHSPITRDLVSCAHCGLYLPASEAQREGENYFCTPAHRQAGKHAPPPDA